MFQTYKVFADVPFKLLQWEFCSLSLYRGQRNWDCENLMRPRLALWPCGVSWCSAVRAACEQLVALPCQGASRTCKAPIG